MSFNVMNTPDGSVAKFALPRNMFCSTLVATAFVLTNRQPNVFQIVIALAVIIIGALRSKGNYQAFGAMQTDVVAQSIVFGSEQMSCFIHSKNKTDSTMPFAILRCLR